MLSVCVRTVLSRLMFFKVNLLTHYLKPLYKMHYLSILMHQLCINAPYNAHGLMNNCNYSLNTPLDAFRDKQPISDEFCKYCNAF